MELNRNQYFLAGLVIFLLGIQLRLVDTFVLNERATHFLAQRMPQIASTSETATLLASTPMSPNPRIQPPNWVGWSFVSVGSVLILYSLAEEAGWISGADIRVCQLCCRQTGMSAPRQCLPHEVTPARVQLDHPLGHHVRLLQLFEKTAAAIEANLLVLVAA